ncbi:Casein kinase II subunit alpha'-interacting protein [Vulpes lagopus]
MVQSCSILPSAKSQDTISQGFYNRALKAPVSQSKHQATPSLDLHQRTSLWPNQRPLSSPVIHHKLQTTSSLDLNKTSSSMESSQMNLKSPLPLPKPQTTPSPNFCWTSPSQKSNPKVSGSSSFPPKYQETLGSNRRILSSTLSQSKSQKASSLDSLWTSLLECNQRSLSSPSLNSTSQINDLLQSSRSLESNQMDLNSLLSDSRTQTAPALNSSSCVLSLPLSHPKPRKSPVAHSVHQTQSLPLFSSKSQTILTLNHDFRTLSSPVCPSKFQNTSSPNDKQRTIDVSPPHSKPNISSQTSSSSKHFIRNIAASKLGSRFQSKNNFDLCAKTESNKEIPWSLDYIYPCILKGGTIPDDMGQTALHCIYNKCAQILAQAKFSFTHKELNE